MAASDKIRWKRMVNEIRFLHNEKEIIEEIVVESSHKFHEHYLRFAAEKDIDIQKLNKENDDKLKELYKDKMPKISPPKNPDIESAITGSLARYEKNEEPPSENYNELQDDKEVSESFRKLFKQLALKLHPDKITGAVTIEQGMENLRLFQEAQSALREKRYFVLLDLADRYNITQSRNYKQQVRWMKKESQNLSSKIQASKSTYNYLYSECETEEQQEALVKKFIAHLFNIYVQ